MTLPPDTRRGETGSPEILLVEDERADALLILRALERCGVDGHIRLIDDGERALDYLIGAPPYDDRQRYPLPRLVLLDLKLRKIGGIDILRRLQTAGAKDRVPVVVLSSSAQNADIENAYRYGANSYLVKPVRFAEFCELADQIRSYWLSTNAPPRSSDL